MKNIGIFLVAIGIIWALIAFNMDTTVSTDSKFYGSGTASIYVPATTVNNIGLMEQKRNNIIFSGLTILSGVLLIGFGSSSGNKSQDGLKPCSSCAELIQPAALKCRFCQSDISNMPDVVSNSPSSMTGTAKHSDPLKELKSHLNVIEQGTASIHTYYYVIEKLGGSLTTIGFIFVDHYLVEIDGIQSRVNSFEELQKWFIMNIIPRIKFDH